MFKIMAVVPSRELWPGAPAFCSALFTLHAHPPSRCASFLLYTQTPRDMFRSTCSLRAASQRILEENARPPNTSIASTRTTSTTTPYLVVSSYSRRSAPLAGPLEVDVGSPSRTNAALENIPTTCWVSTHLCCTNVNGDNALTLAMNMAEVRESSDEVAIDGAVDSPPRAFEDNLDFQEVFPKTSRIVLGPDEYYRTQASDTALNHPGHNAVSLEFTVDLSSQSKVTSTCRGST